MGQGSPEPTGYIHIQRETFKGLVYAILEAWLKCDGVGQ